MRGVTPIEREILVECSTFDGINEDIPDEWRPVCRSLMAQGRLTYTVIAANDAYEDILWTTTSAGLTALRLQAAIDLAP